VILSPLDKLLLVSVLADTLRQADDPPLSSSGRHAANAINGQMAYLIFSEGHPQAAADWAVIRLAEAGFIVESNKPVTNEGEFWWKTTPALKDWYESGSRSAATPTVSACRPVAANQQASELRSPA
jgi:hypothetical protein